MPRFYVVSESTEDTFGSADNLPDAILAANEAACQGRAGEEKTARLWDVVTGKTRGEALPHDGTVLLTVSGSFLEDDKPSAVRMWDVATGKPICRVPHKGVVRGSVFSPDGTVLLLASQQDARLWQVPKLSK